MPRRHRLITAFVIVWTLVFQYETLRLMYLSPLFGRELTKLPLLFPPAGWIMFYQIDRGYGFAEVYGLREEQPFKLDPHDIFENKPLGYDNIHRNVLVSVLSAHDAPRFCRYLHRKLPNYDTFAVVHAAYPDLITAPDRIDRQVVYRCD